MIDQNYREILKGNFQNISQDKSKTVKIFLSSTFADTHAERDYLIENIYPKLRNYCKRTYGLDFQVYDMRWGISNEITSNHLTTTVCLNEIKNCQKYSAGPNFIAFLSHRYGARTLPTRIKSNEFAIFFNESKNLSDQEINFYYKCKIANEDILIGNILESCYELDNNEIPSRYRLKCIDKIIPNYTENDKYFAKVWSQLEKKLGNLLRKIATDCFRKNLINKIEYERYFVSVTEKEIFNGILKAKDVNLNVLYFQRDIIDLEDNLATNVNLVKRFIELDENNKIDQSVKELIDDLKYKKISSKLPQSNIFKFEVKWDKDHGISLKTHPDYIKQFGNTFFEQVKILIDLNQKSNNKIFRENELIQEVVDHAVFCNQTVSKFHGRKDALDKFKEYILDADNQIPFVIFGESGCGKTAILAKLASQIFTIVPDAHNYSVLLRFLGTTPLSSDILKTINSLIEQLRFIFDIERKDEKIFDQFDAETALLETLNFLNKKYPNKKIIIILDSIDQLNPVYYSLQWLIKKLPRNTKMIYSTLTVHGYILENLIGKLKFKNNFFEIKSLDSKLALTIILDWLSKSNRSLSETQILFLKELFKKATLYPLYVKLIYDIVSKWASFYIPDDEFKYCLRIDNCIMYIFKSFEKIHGTLLFSRIIIYMSILKNGISENEIEDILSIDDDVLYQIFEFHAPPIRKLPIVLWARIKNDLNDYIVEKEINGSRVIYWYHRRFIEVANIYYIEILSSDEKATIFSNVVDFFNETWKYKPKPYELNDYLKKKFGVENKETKAIRETGMQPTVLFDSDGKIQFNKRKILELPDLITGLTINMAIPLSCQLIFFDYYFLLGMFRFQSLSNIFEIGKILINQFSPTNEAIEAKNQLNIFIFTLLQSGIIAKNNPESSIIHILSRTLNFYNHLPYFTKLISDYDRESPKLNPLILAHQYIEPPSGDLLFQLDKHSAPITHSLLSPFDERYIFTLSNKLDIFEIKTFSEIGQIKIPNFEFEIMNFSVYLDFEYKENLKLSDFKGGFLISTQNEVKKFDFDSTVKLSLQFFDRIISGVITLFQDYIIVFYKNLNYAEIYNGSKMQERIKFSQNIKIFTSSLRKKYAIEIKNLFRVDLVICLENNEIQVYKIDDTVLGPRLTLLLTIPPSGLNVNSIDFVEKQEQRFTGTPTLLFICYEYFNTLMIDFCQNDTKFFCRNFFQNVSLKPIDSFQELYLFLGSDQNMYIIENFYRWIKIDGNFTNGCFLNKDKICGVERGYLTLFEVNYFKKPAEIIKLKSIEAHYDDITFLSTANSIEMVMTTSLDSTLKVFNTQITENDSLVKFNFDKSIEIIEQFLEINENLLISKMAKSNKIHVWNKPSGKIIKTFSIEVNYIVTEIFYANSNLFLIAYDEKNRSYQIRTFLLIFEQLEIIFNDKSKKIFKEFDKIKFLFTNSTLFILTYKIDSNMFFINKINDNHMNVIRFGIETVSSYFDFSFFDDCCLTFKNELIVIYDGHSIYYINSKTGYLDKKYNIMNQNLDIDYFLSSDKISPSYFKNFKSIENTDDLVMLDNIGSIHFVYIDLKLNEIKNAKTRNYKFVSYKINKNLLLAYDKINSKLACFNLDFVLIKKSFYNSLKFTLDLENHPDHFGLGSQNSYLYIIDNKKNLKFFNIDNSIEKTAQIFLYTQVTCVFGSMDYITFSMKDGKIVSFLISDRKNLEKTYERIKSLPSRNLTQETKQKNELLLNKFKQLYNELNKKKNFFDIHDSTNYYENDEDEKSKRLLVKLNYLTDDGEINEFRSNWAINIFEKNFGILFEIKQDTSNIQNEIENNFEDKNRILKLTTNNNTELLKKLSLLNKNNNYKSKNGGLNVLASNNFPSMTCLIQ